jgi:peptidoglycan/xylan/chitin deacetylase (PgdA/CDA1 family)
MMPSSRRARAKTLLARGARRVLGGGSPLRHALHAAVFYSGMARLLRKRHDSTGRTVTIVTFHRVDDRHPDDPHSLPTLFMSRSFFARTVRFLAERYHVISLDDLLAGLRGERDLPSSSLLLTFDDGYRDVFEHAVPVLAREGLPATVYLPTTFIGSGDRVFWWDECYYLLRAAMGDAGTLRTIVEGARHEGLAGPLRDLGAATSVGAARGPIFAAIDALQSCPDGERETILEALRSRQGAGTDGVSAPNATADWSMVREALARGISFGSHTRTHLFLHRASPEAARRELLRSREEIEERLDRSVRSFAYPGGWMTPDVQRWVRETGYECALTAARGINRVADSPFALKRINLWNGTVAGPGGSFSKAKLAFNLSAGIYLPT